MDNEIAAKLAFMQAQIDMLMAKVVQLEYSQLPVMPAPPFIPNDYPFPPAAATMDMSDPFGLLTPNAQPVPEPEIEVPPAKLTPRRAYYKKNAEDAAKPDAKTS